MAAQYYCTYCQRAVLLDGKLYCYYLRPKEGELIQFPEGYKRNNELTSEVGPCAAAKDGYVAVDPNLTKDRAAW